MDLRDLLVRRRLAWAIRGLRTAGPLEVAFSPSNWSCLAVLVAIGSGIFGVRVRGARRLGSIRHVAV
jgi:hypothetical protein